MRDVGQKLSHCSHSNQLNIIPGGARVAGGMSGKDCSTSVTAINWRLHRMEQGLPEGCLGKTVTFSHTHQLEITSGGARVTGGMSGKDCHIQSHPLAGDHIRWNKSCQRDVRKTVTFSHIHTSIH